MKDGHINYHCEALFPIYHHYVRLISNLFTYFLLLKDLDECKVRPDVCRDGRCVNTDGSFRCECAAGYTLDATGLACVDADECAADPRVCGNGTCTNLQGGYQCTCNRGFTEGSDHTCVDIDECAEGRAMCSWRCHNTLGSFRCTCPYGYAAAPDGVHCRDIDECAADPPPCPHACENTVGSYICKCAEGECSAISRKKAFVAERLCQPHDDTLISIIIYTYLVTAVAQRSEVDLASDTR
ncbi:hypothetical protein evm_005760 [Chilo suppressalis]|nr:hypothetical protein evm_005760 [Chilo suppressalis]